jgi:hypothetical protein
MAIVADLARPGDVIDVPLSSPNRRVAGAPASLSLVPLYAGEIVQNTSNGDLWFAAGLTATAWAPYANLG